MSIPLSVLYEDNHLLVVDKPAMIPTMGVADDRPTMLVLAKDYVKRKYRKPGKVYLGIVSRLDAPVTGILVLARTSKAASRLTAMQQAGCVEKRYWAIVDCQPEPDRGECCDYLRKSERHRRVEVVGESEPGAQKARLAYRTLQHAAAGYLLEVRLHTGRKHQIRVQLAQRGWPIRGDRKYGSLTAFPRGIALHAAHLLLEHPVRHEPLEVHCPPPPYWPRAFAMEHPN